ncbi:hypothetical protein [Pontimicrobium sp. SW4]|uniref:Uncharacterized protein n=1 Tax=Pontimicrobium sp. SW4 TaxID=3153519 RepID=A0AAU7BSJ9_9FLAO
MTDSKGANLDSIRLQRLDFFQNCCDKLIIEFGEIYENGANGSDNTTRPHSNFLATIFDQLKSKELIESIKFVVDKNSALLINENYWFMLDNIARKIINVGKNDDDGESSVDVYKILSITEFAVIATQPVVLEFNGDLEEGSRLFKQLTITERLVNGYFAWVCAYEFLSSWTSLKDLTYNKEESKQLELDKIWKDIQFYKEDIPERERALTIFVEHIRIVSNSNPISFPIWTNAMWWRMLLLHIQDRVSKEIKENPPKT